MIYREFTHEGLAETLKDYPEYVDETFDPEEWVNAKGNILLTDGEGSYGLFDLQRPFVYCGHYFFRKRGKAAISLAREILDFMFDLYKAEVILGMTPVDNRKARWMSRHLGFSSQGLVTLPQGECEMFYLNKGTEE